MKKIGFFTLILCLIFAFTLGTFAEDVIKEIKAYINSDINISWNGEEYVPRESNGDIVHPIIYKGRSYLPLQFTLEKAGLSVDWDGDNNTIVIKDHRRDLDDIAEAAIPYRDGDIEIEYTNIDDEITGKDFDEGNYKPQNNFFSRNIDLSSIREFKNNRGFGMVWDNVIFTEDMGYSSFKVSDYDEYLKGFLYLYDSYSIYKFSENIEKEYEPIIVQFRADSIDGEVLGDFTLEEEELVSIDINIKGVDEVYIVIPSNYNSKSSTKMVINRLEFINPKYK